MNLTKDEKDFIRNNVTKNFDDVASKEYQKICIEEKKLILSSDIFKHYETELFLLLTNCGHPQTDIKDNFDLSVCNDVIIFKYYNYDLGICYEKRFNFTKLNKSITQFRPITLRWGDPEYDTLFSKAFIEVKDLKTKATRMTVVNDVINKLTKEMLTKYKSIGKEYLKDIKNVLPILNTTYYPNYNK